MSECVEFNAPADTVQVSSGRGGRAVIGHLVKRRGYDFADATSVELTQTVTKNYSCSLFRVQTENKINVEIVPSILVQ